MFLGDDLLVWLLLALGAAMVVGHAAALLRPPPASMSGSLTRSWRLRSVVMIVIGLVAAVPALATLTR